MIFMLNTSLSLQIIALVAATFLFVWGLSKPGCGSCMAKFIGFIATLIALCSLVSSLVFAGKAWQEGRMMREAMQPMPPHEMSMDAPKAPHEKPEHPAKKN